MFLQVDLDVLLELTQSLDPQFGKSPVWKVEMSPLGSIRMCNSDFPNFPWHILHYKGPMMP